MVLFSSELEINDKDVDANTWIHRIDRGGLWHVKDVYLLFNTIEEEIQHHFTVKSQESMLSRVKVFDTIYKIEDVKLQWMQLASDNVDTSISTFPLKK